ncbi:aminoglycoside phosphotransferase family protein [Amycolatopsis rubida]|uniref:Aminoglycoside phosphotransferase family protein n=1 Tax=Amycolatopsis rubida TaxID=112413 RepID=A0ABX0C144_9PSEU|nr:aminoglycoside phosphotransferase family protein [Amycolatopsis sp. M39]MYW94892.1 phosphotransferase [Amycolatopsis rubida]MYW95888.1 phosphotransferase [Amycolatopsis rubida]NEC59879.1 aminoglycoside phosphotransferase family protein [Amycolatopsis rubida]NEC60878.1 aminoglycoside phosphotransferase family protein [Amycolatopsis rubida]OAP26652.1 Phosphotransferase enzyme family protein [Amycolatopsis sp. M39]
MDFQPQDRPSDAFQQPLSADQIELLCRRALGSSVRSAVEIGWGGYNNTYRVELADGPAILRVAPEPARQTRIEPQFMRNEYLAAPYFAPISPLMPRTLAADFTHQVIGRDYVLQAVLPGAPGPEILAGFEPRERTPYFHQLGEITRTVHDVRGPGFGLVAGPHFATWSEALIAYFEDNAADVEDLGLDGADLRAVAAWARRDAALLDEITEPRLLHGDLWHVNVMLTPELEIVGVFDHDRSWWGDPAADWTIRMASAKTGSKRDSFWDTYGRPDASPPARRRALYYEARHLGAVRLERYRLGKEGKVEESYPELAEILAALESGA